MRNDVRPFGDFGLGQGYNCFSQLIVLFFVNWKLIESGKDGYTFGKLGQTSLGDLVTIINSYDETVGYSSNSLSAYFHELADSRKLNRLVQSDWLGIDGLTLGGRYGEASPSDLSGLLMSAKGNVNEANLYQIDSIPNSLSTLASAEMFRRLVQHDIVEENVSYNIFRARIY